MLSYCEPHYFEINIEITDKKDEHSITDEIVDSFAGVDVGEQDYGDVEDGSLREELFEKILLDWALKANMKLLIDTLEMCCKERIPMIWGDPADTAVVTIYTKYLLDKYAKGIDQHADDEKVAAFLRTIKGDDLLQSIFGFNIVNVGTVPVYKIVEFRKNNRDLLASFLTSYRSFLTELQSDPLNYRKIILARTQKLTEEMNTINMELLIRRRTEKYKWLERMSEAFYQSAKSGAVVALWNLLASPILMAGQIGINLLSAANTRYKDIQDRKQLENALLFRSSSGYLWKAMQEFAE